MATKKFLIEVEEGNTECNKCPLYLISDCIKVGRMFISKGATCHHLNLATMKIKEPISYEKLQEFAIQYSHNIWEQLMQRFKADDEFYIGANDVSDYVLNAILDTYQKMMEENNESKS